MKNWLLSVSVAALVISVILLVIPKGKTSVTIKVIAGFLVSFVILQAVISVDFSVVATEKLFGNGMTEYQTDYLEFVREQKTSAIKKTVIAVLEKRGIKISANELNILTGKSPDKYEIEKITINLNGAVISEDTEHIDIKETILKCVSESLGIEIGAVVVYGD